MLCFSEAEVDDFCFGVGAQQVERTQLEGFPGFEHQIVEALDAEHGNTLCLGYLRSEGSERFHCIGVVHHIGQWSAFGHFGVCAPVGEEHHLNRLFVESAVEFRIDGEEQAVGFVGSCGACNREYGQIDFREQSIGGFVDQVDGEIVVFDAYVVFETCPRVVAARRSSGGLSALRRLYCEAQPQLAVWLIRFGFGSGAARPQPHDKRHR